MATHEFLSSGGSTGACVGFNTALGVKRMVFVTEGSMSENMESASVLCQALQRIDCKWHMQSADALRAHVGPDVPQRARRQREVLAFMTKEEIDAEELRSNID